MVKAQYGILRFAKYKGPEIGQIEAHNERTKESYASNPDIDTNRSKLNFNLLPPPPKYRAEAERQIREGRMPNPERQCPAGGNPHHRQSGVLPGEEPAGDPGIL